MLVDMGRLSLSLRSLGRQTGDDGAMASSRPTSRPSYTLDTQVSVLPEPPAPPPVPEKAAPVAPPVQHVSIVRGAASEALIFTSQGDPVSVVRAAEAGSEQ